MSVLITFIKLIAVFDLLVIAVYFGGDILLPCQGRLAGGDQCHKAFFCAVSPHPQHRARYVPNAGAHCPARS